ncbi:MAG: carboxypeptidase regulatory-like domain-containing protein, partial [Pyrinomonadaceae bacterium]
MNYLFRPARFFSVLILIFAASAISFGQATTADILGTVEDPTGRVIPGATVTATNVATNQSRKTTTNDSGNFAITNLQPGRYNVTVEAASFSKAVVKDIELNVGANRTLQIDLKVGQISEIVEITANDALIEVSRSDIGTTVSPKEIENLPLLNRTFAGLSIIAPEARPVGNFDPTKTRVGNIAFAGGDGRQVNVNIDGGDNKDNVVGSLLQNFSYESIQEFQVIQHRWTAEQGRSVGGIVNVITKSGTNNLHGSLFGNFRDEKLRAFDFFDDIAKITNPAYTKPEFNRQEFGGSIGGPIKKDRTFFFFALERFRERQNVAIFPAAVAEIKAIPGNNFVPVIPTPYNDTLLSAKVDHRFNAKHSMFGRFSYQGNDSPNDQVANPARTDLSGGNLTTNKLYSALGNYTYNITPNVLNQFTFHFQDFVNEILPMQEGLTLNFPGGISIGQNANTPQATKERKFQFRNDLSVVSGNHSMKFGVNYIHTILDGYFYFGTRGYSLTFGQSPTAIAALPGGFATPGLLTALTFSDGASSHFQKIDQLAFYAQDDWKIRPNLTFNLGLR